MIKRKCNHIVGIYVSGEICTLEHYLWNKKVKNEEFPDKYFRFCPICGRSLKYRVPNTVFSEY